ncbi:hypothetical protein D3C86_1398730 [compost metagenome]
MRALAGGGVFAVFCAIELQGYVAGERATTFVQRFHGQQHAAHVRVHDDRIGDLVRIGRAGWRTALDSVLGVFDGVLIGAFTEGQALDPDAQAFVVHHGEHRRQAFVRRIDDVTGGAVEIHHTGGRGLDAHLVLDRTAGQAVAFTQRAVGIDHEFRHQEQRNAFGAWRSIRQSGQHQVNDVFGEVVLTAGDEDLGAADLVAAVGLWLGPGADNAQVGTGVWLGQAHGTGPDTGIHVRKVGRFQRFAAMGIDRQAGAGGQHRIQAE